MIDLGEKFVGTEKWSPPLENRVCHLQDTVVDPRIVWSEARDKILRILISISLTAVRGVAAHTSIKVSHLWKKSLSAMMLMASPS